MGRARNRIDPAATASFGTVLGPRRGAAAHDLLTAPEPSAAARAELALLLASVDRGDLATPLTVLRKHSRQLTAPLLTELAGRVAERVADDDLALNAAAHKRLLHSAGVRAETSSCLLVDGGGVDYTLHLWVGGARFGPYDRPRGQRTACGRTVDFRAMARAPRGAWREPQMVGATRCNECDRFRDDVPECQERQGYPVFGQSLERYQTRFRESLRRRVPRWVAYDDDLSVGQLRAQAQALGQHELVAVAAEVAQHMGEPALQRALGRELYESAREEMGDGDLHLLADFHCWHEYLSEVAARGSVLDAPPRQLLLTLLRTRLAGVLSAAPRARLWDR